MASLLYSTVLAHANLESATCFILANQLSDGTLLSTQLQPIFLEVLRSNEPIGCAIAADVCAFHDRDPACDSYIQPLMFFKGFLAIQAYRIANHLWKQGRR